MSERCNLSTCLWGQTIETQALGIHPQKAVLACRYEGCALGLSCRTMSWADALGRALGKPSGPDVALKSVFITAELGEVMLAWCHFSVNHLKDSWGGFGSKETQKTLAEIKKFWSWHFTIRFDKGKKKKKKSLIFGFLLACQWRVWLTIKETDCLDVWVVYPFLSGLLSTLEFHQEQSSIRADCYCSAG